MQFVKKFFSPEGEEDGPGGRPDDRKPPVIGPETPPPATQTVEQDTLANEEEPK